MLVTQSVLAEVGQKNLRFNVFCTNLLNLNKSISNIPTLNGSYTRLSWCLP